jgi:type IV pilus assembly PilX-like protein
MHRNPRSEHGVAMVVAMMAMLLMSALGLALVLTTTSETLISANFRNGQEAVYAADAVIERAIDDLLTVPDWNKLLDGSEQSGFIDGPPSGARTLNDGSTIDLTQAVNMANCQKIATCTTGEMNANSSERPWGTNNPRWHLYAYGNLNDMLPTGTINSPFYVVLFVGDDPSETDGDPTKDGAAANNPGSGVLAMRAEAFGPRGAHKVIEVTLARTDTTQLERGYTGQRGQDEQNRRARKAAVQTPGKALTMQTLTLSTGGVQ